MNDSYGMSIVQLLQKIVKGGGTSSGGNTGTGGNVSVDLSYIEDKLETIVDLLDGIYSATVSVADYTKPLAFEVRDWDNYSIYGVLKLISSVLNFDINGSAKNNILTKLNNIESAISQNSSVDMTDTNNLLSDISSKLTFTREESIEPLELENETRKGIEDVSIARGISELIVNSNVNKNLMNDIDGIIAAIYENTNSIKDNTSDTMYNIRSINEKTNNTNVILKDIMSNMFPTNYYVTPESDVVGPGPFMLCNITNANITIKIIKYNDVNTYDSDVTHDTLINDATDYTFIPGWNPIPIQYALDVPANSFTHAEYKNSIQ